MSHVPKYSNDTIFISDIDMRNHIDELQMFLKLISCYDYSEQHGDYKKIYLNVVLG